MTDDRVLYMVEQIRLAETSREIAAHLLRVPDTIVLSHGVELQLECAAKTFAAGVTFLTHRAAALNAVRDAHGMIPEQIGLELEMWRFTFSRFASGQRRELPAEFTGRADGAAQN